MSPAGKDHGTFGSPLGDLAQPIDNTSGRQAPENEGERQNTSPIRHQIPHADPVGTAVRSALSSGQASKHVAHLLKDPYDFRLLRSTVQDLFSHYHARVTGNSPTLRDVHTRQTLSHLKNVLGTNIKSLEVAKRLVEEVDEWVDEWYREDGLWLNYAYVRRTGPAGQIPLVKKYLLERRIKAVEQEASYRETS